MKHNNTPSGLKLRTPHLLKLNINKINGIANAPKLNIQKEHFHFFKMQKSPMNKNKQKNCITTDEPLSKKNQKLKLISSNGQNYFCFNQNKGESGIKIISKKESIDLPYTNTEYKVNCHNTINSDCTSMNQYKKLSKEQIQRIRQLNTMKTITNTNTLTDSCSITKDETKSRMERSKSTLNTKSISLRNNKLKVLKRSLSNKRNVLKILDDTIKGLTKLKTIILDDEEEEYKYDDDEIDFSKEDSNKKKKNKIKQKLQNGIMNMNELINSSFTGELIKKERKRHLNRTIDIDSCTPCRKRNEKIIINMENHKYSPTTTQHRKHNSLYSNYNYSVYKERKEKTHSIIKVDNVDKEVPIKIKTFQRNNSELVKNIMSVNKTLNNMKKGQLKTSSSNVFRRSNRYSDSDTLANFEFDD